MLTKSQKATIDAITKYTGSVTLYRETSLSGQSETLRWRRQFVEQTKWGPATRTRTGMILSVMIHVIGDKDDPADLEKYDKLCQEAERYFTAVRAEAEPC